MRVRAILLALVIITASVGIGCSGTEEPQPLSAKKPLGMSETEQLQWQVYALATRVAEVEQRACEAEARERLDLTPSFYQKVAPVWNENRRKWKPSPKENEYEIFGRAKGLAAQTPEQRIRNRGIVDPNWLATAYLYWWWSQCKNVDDIGTVDNLRVFLSQP